MILITGGHGQLGTELRHLLDEKKIEYVSTDADQLDITDKEGTYKFITEMKPELIYHCAAYTAVDKAEDECGWYTQCSGGCKGSRSDADLYQYRLRL